MALSESLNLQLISKRGWNLKNREIARNVFRISSHFPQNCDDFEKNVKNSKMPNQPLSPCENETAFKVINNESVELL